MKSTIWYIYFIYILILQNLTLTSYPSILSLLLLPKTSATRGTNTQDQILQGPTMPDCSHCCCSLIVYGPGFILFIIGLSLPSPKHQPVNFWLSLFSPILVTIVWLAIILIIGWMVESITELLSGPQFPLIVLVLPARTPPDGPQGAEITGINFLLLLW